MPLVVAELIAKVGADIADLRRGMREAETTVERTRRNFENLGRSMGEVGQRMTRRVTLPVLAAGAGAIKVANDFNTSMSRIQGLVGVAADEVEKLRKGTLALAGETARSPRELAEGAYFVLSSGIQDTALALEVLQVSAKSAAAGLGETGVIANAVTSIMNAYGQENISAAQAASILVATVREGKAEADELAGSINRVIPLASQLGVGFDEVGAAIASMTLLGASADESVTALRSVFSVLIREQPQVTKALEAVGIDLAGIRQTLREDGLLPALDEMTSGFLENEAALSQLFPNIRAITGVLSLLGENTESTRRIFEELANTTEQDLENAFQAFADTAAFDMQQALAELEAAAIGLGTTIAPLAADILGFITTLVRGFSELPGPIKTTTLVLIGIGAAAGPLLIVASGVVRLKLALDQLAISSARAATAFRGAIAATGIIGTALTAATFFLGKYNTEKAKAVELSGRFTDALLKEKGALTETVEQEVRLAVANSDAAATLREFDIDVNNVIASITDMEGDLQLLADFFDTDFVDPLAAFRQAVTAGGFEHNALAEQLLELWEAGQLTEAQIESLIDALAPLEEEFIGATERAKDQAFVLGDVKTEVDVAAEAIREASGALGGLGTEAGGANVELEALNKTLDDLLDGAFSVAEAQDDLTRSMQEFIQGVIEQRQQGVAAAGALEGMTQAALDNREGLRGIIEDTFNVVRAMAAHNATAEQIQGVLLQQRAKLLAVAEALGLNTEALAPYIALLEAIPEQVHTEVTVSVKYQTALVPGNGRDTRGLGRDRPQRPPEIPELDVQSIVDEVNAMVDAATDAASGVSSVGDAARQATSELFGFLNANTRAADAVERTKDATGELVKALAGIGTEGRSSSEVLTAVHDATVDVVEGIQAEVQALADAGIISGDYNSVKAEMVRRIGQVRDTLPGMIQGFIDGSSAVQSLADVIETVNSEFDRLIGVQLDAADATERVDGLVNDLKDSLFELMQRELSPRELFELNILEQESRAALAEVNRLKESVGETSQEYVDALARLQKAESAVRQPFLESARLRSGIDKKVRDLVRSVKDEAIALAEAGVIGQDHASITQFMQDRLRDLADEVPDVRDEIIRYADSLDQIKPRADTQLAIQGLAEAQRVLDHYIGIITNFVPKEVTTTVRAVADTSGLSGIGSAITTIINPLGDLARAIAELNRQIALLPDALRMNPEGFPLPRAALGGVVTRPTMLLAGEAGAEAIVPLTNPTRAAEVMAEAGLTGGNVYDIDVFAQTNADSREIARDIVWELDG